MNTGYNRGVLVREEYGRMKFLKKAFLLSIIALPMLMLSSAPMVSASSFRNEQDATVAKDESLDDTLYIYGSSVVVAGTVNGDVYCAGQSITVSGTVNGDVICAGQSIRVGGTVNGDVRLAAQFIEVSGKVDSNATLAAQSFSLPAGGAITGDVTLMSGNADISGTVGRDIVAEVDQLTLAGQVGRNTQAEAESLVLRSTAKVGGTLNYQSGKQAEIRSGASVLGGVNRQERARQEDKGAPWAALGYTLVSLLTVAMILALLAPRLFQAVSEEGRLHLGRSLVAGLIGVVIIPAAILLLIVSVIGAPLGILLGLLWAALLFLSGPALAYYVGRMVLTRSNNSLLYMLVGSLALLILYAVPILNALVVIAVLVLGSGMLISRTILSIGKPAYTVTANKKG